jgi:hypothetical protein
MGSHGSRKPGRGWGGGACSDRGRMGQRKKPDLRGVFLEQLAAGLSISQAAQAIETGRATVYRWRDQDKDFAAVWDSAYDECTDVLEQEAQRPAVGGVQDFRLDRRTGTGWDKPETCGMRASRRTLEGKSPTRTWKLWSARVGVYRRPLRRRRCVDRRSARSAATRRRKSVTRPRRKSVTRRGADVGGTWGTRCRAAFEQRA